MSLQHKDFPNDGSRLTLSRRIGGAGVSARYARYIALESCLVEGRARTGRSVSGLTWIQRSDAGGEGKGCALFTLLNRAHLARVSGSPEDAAAPHVHYIVAALQQP